MPIYDFQCSSCGFKDALIRKISDASVSQCPNCSQATFSKMLSAPSFQLNGTGWYATDFKGGGKKPDIAATESTASKTSETSSAAACNPGCACH